MQKILLLSFFTLLVSSKLLAEQTIYEVRYTKTNDTIDTVAERYLPIVKIKYGKRLDDYKSDLKKWNSNITDWDHLEKSTPLYIDYPYPAYIEHNYAPKLSATDYENEKKSRFNASLSYTASAGMFTEVANSEELKSTQNSLFSLGAGGSYDFSNHDHFLISSIYWSRLSAGKIEGTTSTQNNITIPSEMGGNLYYQYTFTDSLLSFYGGLDYESLGTYNTRELTAGTALETRTNKFTYGTLGIGKTFNIKSYPITTKLSFSTTLSSSSSSTNTTDTFSGSRALFFTNVKYDEHFGVHFLYKRHDLNGPTKLTINRLGLGLNYSF
jgi:hypothetical protein